MNEQAGNANAGGQVAVAMNLRGRDGGAMPELDDLASLRAASGGSSRSYVVSMQVRRLTPRECERLQGFPDDYTLIPIRARRKVPARVTLPADVTVEPLRPIKMSADCPRYKALGNSMAVPCMRWIGERIAMVQRLTDEADDGAATREAHHA